MRRGFRKRRVPPPAVIRAAATAVLSAVLVASVGVGVAHAEPAAPSTPPAGTPAVPAPAGPDRVSDPDRVLGPGWRTDADRSVTTSGDETGLHLLVANRKDGYTWHTAATLVEPGTDTDQWIGQYCVTGSQRRAVVVYAPRQYANRGDLMTAGAFAAVVDLDSGTVTKLAQRVTLAYYNPACNAGETAVLSAAGGTDQNPSTRVTVLDTATGQVRQSVTARGQLTSSTLVGNDLYAAAGSGVVRVAADGGTTLVAPTTGTPYRLAADGADDLSFEVNGGGQTRFDRLADGRVSHVASAPTGLVRIRAGAAGKVFVVGDPGSVHWAGSRPAGWQSVDAPVDSEVSGLGKLAVTSASSHTEAAGTPGGGAVDGVPDQVGISAKLTGGATLTFGLQPAPAAAGTRPSPALGTPSSSANAVAPDAHSLVAPVDASAVSWDPDRACAVPRNDPTVQVYQPTPKQVEWAADLASHGQLTISRAANWLNSGLPAYSPQDLFKPITPKTPAGDSRWVPAQVLLGILAQESNLRQASWHVTDGSSGNPLTSPGFYGLDQSQNPTSIDWSRHDCGYGVGQVTAGMLVTDTDQPGGLTDLQQRAVAVDYATNIAAAAHILEQAWQDTQQAQIIANNGDPQFIENWFFAVWAYNTGMHANTGSGPWGLGWLNNPANPNYPADRHPYLIAPLNTATHHDEIAYDNAKHPSDWSYPERVMGWAKTAVILPDYADNGNWKSTYQPGLWPGGDTGFIDAQPGHNVACVASLNNCDPAAPPHKSTDPHYSNEPAGPCQQNDLTQCWWHSSAQWVDCTTKCGSESRVYTTVDPRPYATNIHPEQCSVVGLPSNARIVDDITASKPLGPDGCSPVASGGHFDLKFAGTAGPNGSTIYPSKVDFHQIGGGFGGHFWFTHTQQPSAAALKVTGTWTPASPMTGWVQVMVHLPDIGAWTQQAHYIIHTGNGAGTDRDRYLSTDRAKNTWVQLGTYQFGTAGPQGLELSNFTEDGAGDVDIAWDAAAFVPLTAKPKHFVVAIGDSFQSGENAGSYYNETDRAFDSSTWNACRRSTKAWPRLITLPGQSSSVGTLADKFDPSVDFEFMSCSGAKASNMADNTTRYWWTHTETLESLHDDAEGQFGEKDQVDSGVLSPDTTLVLLSAGGNDASFPDVMQDCANGDCTANSAAYAQQIQAAQGAVNTLIASVHNKAPNARIVLVGYPKLFADDHARSCSLVLTFATYTDGEMNMLNSLADTMKTAQANTVTQAQQGWGTGKANFVDMVSGFGDHGICQNADTIPVPSEDISGLVRGPAGPGDFQDVSGVHVRQCLYSWLPGNWCLSRSSLHPKDTGAARYATAVTGALVSMGYQ